MAVLRMLIPAALVASVCTAGQVHSDEDPKFMPVEVFSQPAVREADGPWKHKVYFATSTDGLSFDEGAEPVMLQASVPDIIQLERDLPKAGDTGTKGTLIIYAVDGRGRQDPPVASGLVRLTSTDGGKTWSRPQGVSITSRKGEFDGPAVDPSIIQLEDGRLRLYVYHMAPPKRRGPGEPMDFPGELPERTRKPLQPSPAPDSPDAPADPDFRGPRNPDQPARKELPHGIYSAVSSDGVSFTLEEGVRFEEPRITDPEVVRSGDQWLMFLSRGQEVLLARSLDGLNFVKDQSFILRGGGVPGALSLGDGRVRVYQSSPEGVTSSIFDPKEGTFKPEEGVRFKAPCGDPAVWPRAGGGYVAVVKRFIATTGQRWRRD